MPTLTILRAVPFVRGDESISIWIDDKSIGMLPTAGPLVKEIPAGAHKLQAWMNGASGKKIFIEASEGNAASIILSNTKMASGSSWPALVLWLVILIPESKLPGWGMWIIAGLVVLFCAWSIHDLLKRKRDFLKLELIQMYPVEMEA